MVMEISPEEDVFFRNVVKKELRKRMRGVRATLPASAIAARSALLTARLREHSCWQRARAIGLFWPMAGRNEVDVRPLFSAALRSGKRVALPRLDTAEAGDNGEATWMRLCWVDDEGALAERGHGFAEPPPEATVALPGDVDLIVVPALALDVRGHRIGYGAGYYDRMLPQYAPPAFAVGVAFDFQLVPELPATATDVPVALVVTDTRDFLAGALSSSPSLAEPLAAESQTHETGPPGQGAVPPCKPSWPPPSSA